MKTADLRNIIREEIKKVIREDNFELTPKNIDSQQGRSDSYLFTVENDEEGRQRIQRAKEALNQFFKFRVRGRHHDRKEVMGDKWRPGQQNDVPVAQAEYLAVYVEPK